MAYGPLWSLAVEEQYYLVWPLVVRKLNVRLLFWITATVFVYSALIRGLAFYMGHPKGIDWYTWYVLDGLAAGSILAIVLRGSMDRSQVRLLCISLIGVSIAMALVGAPYGILTRERLLGAAVQFSVVHIFFAGVLLFFLLIGTSKHRAWVNNRLLGFFGYISYGLYLFHFLVFRIYDKVCAHYFPQLQPADWRFGLVVLRFVIGGGVATGIAFLSRRYYEAIFLQMKEKFTPRSRSPKISSDPLVRAVAASE